MYLLPRTVVSRYLEPNSSQNKHYHVLSVTLHHRLDTPRCITLFIIGLFRYAKFSYMLERVFMAKEDRAYTR